MPDIAAEEFHGGHGLKTSLAAGFEGRSHKPKAIVTVPILCASSAVRPDGCRCR